MNSLNKYEMLMVKMLSALPPKLLSKESVRCFWLVSHQFNSASVIISSIARQQRLFSLWEHRSQSLINPENSTDVTAVPYAEQKRHTLSALILTNWKLHSFYLELLKSSCCCCLCSRRAQTLITPNLERQQEPDQTQPEGERAHSRLSADPLIVGPAYETIWGGRH